MDRTDERLSIAVLAFGAALVVAAGIAWWVAAAPELAAQPIETPPPAVAPERVAPESQLTELDSFLPQFDKTLHRETFRLAPGETFPVTFQAEKDKLYLAQYVCMGEGELLLRIRGTTEGEMMFNVDCGGSVSAYQFAAANPTVVVEVTRNDQEPAGIGVQIVEAE